MKMRSSKTSPSNTGLRVRRGQRLRISLPGHGQAQHKHRTALGLVLAGDLSPMILHHAVHGAQSQASALADRLCSIERIEHPMRLFYAWSAIGKLHHHFLTLALGADAKHTA